MSERPQFYPEIEKALVTSIEADNKSGQAPDLNDLQPHPDKKRIDLVRAAEAAQEAEHPSTPGQIAATSREGVPNLASIRQQVTESKPQDPEQIE